MKTFLTILLISATATFCCAQNQPKDPQFTPEQIRAIQSACPPKAAPTNGVRRVLLYSKTGTWRHNTGIVACKIMFQKMSEMHGAFIIDLSENPKDISAKNLAKYDAVILCHSTGMAFGPTLAELEKMTPQELKNAQRLSNARCNQLIKFVENGGGVFAIHGGIDCYNKPLFMNKKFTDMLGGQFISHPWYSTNPAVTVLIDDADSPITKGIWDKNAFKIEDEIYQMGDSFDRKNCRVLMSIDVDNSPVMPLASGNNIKVRPDRDIPMVWIKKFGKGRVAYGGFLHDERNASNPKIQELYLRLLQFATGDIDADVESLPKTDKSAYIPILPAPSIKEISVLSNLKYGEMDAELNSIIFGVCANNGNKAYCRELENFILEQLEDSVGTEEYRAFLAEILWFTGIKSSRNLVHFKKLEKSEKCESIRGRLSNAIAHTNNSAALKERSFRVPKEPPCDGREFIRTIRFLAENPSQKIPEWLCFENLDENGKAMLLGAMLERGDDVSAALKLRVSTEALALAMARAVAKIGPEDGIERILSMSDLVSDKKRTQLAACILALPCPKNPPKPEGYTTPQDFPKENPTAVKLLNESFAGVSGKRAATVYEALSHLDISGIDIFNGYGKNPPEAKLGAINAAEAMADKNAFMGLMKILGSEENAGLKKSAIQAIFTCAKGGIDADMFAELSKLWKNSDNSMRSILIKLLPMVNRGTSKNALNLCKSAVGTELEQVAYRTFSQWRFPEVMPILVDLAKAAAPDTKRQALAQKALVGVGSRLGFDDAAADYMLRNAISPQDRDICRAESVKNPTPSKIKSLRESGAPKDLIKLAEKNLKKR